MLSSEDRDALIALEETLWLAETRFDPDLMDQTFSSEFVEFGRSGRRYERAEMLFDPDPWAEINASLPLPNYSVELVAANVALATYTSEVRYGDEIELGRRSSLWIKPRGRWQLRFHQATPC